MYAKRQNMAYTIQGWSFSFAHSLPVAFTVLESTAISLAPFVLSLGVFCPLFYSFVMFPFAYQSLPLSPFLPLSFPLCLCGPSLGWLLLAAPVPPTLSLDMLFIGLPRGWLSVQGGCCLKQYSLNKRGRSSQRALWLMCSLSVSVNRHQVHHYTHTSLYTLCSYQHNSKYSIFNI